MGSSKSRSLRETNYIIAIHVYNIIMYSYGIVSRLEFVGGGGR